MLAFDGACGICKSIAGSVQELSAGRIDVVPLKQSDVEDLRVHFYGSSPPWRPTLVRVRADGVSAWTGCLLAIRLAARLGLATTVDVLRALGEVRETQRRRDAHADQEGGAGARSGFDRKRFLKIAGGAAFVAGLSIAGQTPAFASSESSRARSWVAANLGNLPASYDAIAEHPLAFRKAILSKLDPISVGNLWIEQLQRYKAANPTLSSGQVKVLDEGIALARDLFGSQDRAAFKPRLKRLEEAAKAAFGVDQAGRLFAQLGPDDPDASKAPALNPICTCSQQSDYCGSGKHCGTTVCNEEDDCGTFHWYTCDGLCFYN